LVQNAQNIGMVVTVFEALVSHKSFLETCNSLRSHAIRHDQQNKEKNARQINSTSQTPGTSKKEKIKAVLALINELQVQDSVGSDEEIDTSPSSKTALVCKLPQVPPEICMTLSLEAKKWLLNERKRQQQGEDKSKKSSDTNGNDAFKMSERNKNDSSKLPNQYAKVKSAVKGEEEVQDDADHKYEFVDEFLEEALNTSNMYKAQQDTDYDFWTSDHNVHTSISINNT
jgi:hypothetical protein